MFVETRRAVSLTCCRLVAALHARWRGFANLLLRSAQRRSEPLSPAGLITSEIKKYFVKFSGKQRA